MVHTDKRTVVSGKRLKAVELLATGEGTSAVASAVGVHPSTIRRWANEPDFAGELQDAQAEVRRMALRGLAGLGSRALNTLREVLGDRDAAPSARVSAARVVMEAIMRLDEAERLADIEERLDLLEGKSCAA